MTNAKRKGNAGETVCKKCLAEAMDIPESEIRKSSQAHAWGGYSNSDLVIWKAENLHIECKHTKNFTWNAFRKQLQDDIKAGSIPVLMHLQSGDKDPRWAYQVGKGKSTANYEPWIHLPLKCMIDFCVSVLERSGWTCKPKGE